MLWYSVVLEVVVHFSFRVGGGLGFVQPRWPISTLFGNVLAQFRHRVQCGVLRSEGGARTKASQSSVSWCLVQVTTHPLPCTRSRRRHFSAGLDWFTVHCCRSGRRRRGNSWCRKVARSWLNNDKPLSRRGSPAARVDRWRNWTGAPSTIVRLAVLRHILVPIWSD